MPYHPKEKLSTRLQPAKPKTIAKKQRKLKQQPAYHTPEKE